jgi:aspartate kinase
MSVIVQKYGGSSLSTSEFIKRVADRIIRTKQEGHDVVVVVSAPGDTTDTLVNMYKDILENPPRREMDMLLSVGERITTSLLTMAIIQKGFPAIGLTGPQAGIITNTDHTRARLLEIKPDRMINELKEGKIVVVSGYQGVSITREITTLGRGGSDITAVAIAAALSADKCEIMTDVDGIFTSNPRMIIDAQKISELSLDEMLDLAELGSQVLKTSAVEFAKRHNIKIHVGSSYTGKIGTIVTTEALDKRPITGIAVDKDVALLTISNCSPRDTYQFLKNIAREKVGVKHIWQDGQSAKILLEPDDLPQVRELIQHYNSAWNITFNEELAVISVIGTGIGFKTDIISELFQLLDEMNIIPETYGFSESRISLGIQKDIVKSVAEKFHHFLFTGKKI